MARIEGTSCKRATFTCVCDLTTVQFVAIERHFTPSRTYGSQAKFKVRRGRLRSLHSRRKIAQPDQEVYNAEVLLTGQQTAACVLKSTGAPYRLRLCRAPAELCF